MFDSLFEFIAWMRRVLFEVGRWIGIFLGIRALFELIKKKMKRDGRKEV